MIRRIDPAARRGTNSTRAVAGVLVAAGVVIAACGETSQRSGSAPSAPPASARAAVSSAQLKPVRNFDLSVENLEGLYLAHLELQRLMQTNPEALERLQEAINEVPEDGVDEVVRAFAQEPDVRDALQKAKMSPREFYLTQLNLMDAVTILQARAVGRTAELPDVSDRNVDFVRLHAQEVQRVMTVRRPRELQ